ncbi:SET domain-containing protein [Ditylenchus destructor]|nr:SET domain-containing protein [Ditylenchus destructor]
MSLAKRCRSFVDDRRSKKAAKKHKSMPVHDNSGDESDDTELNKKDVYSVAKILAMRNVKMAEFDQRNELRLLIAGKLNAAPSSSALYGCHRWEDELNKVVSECDQAPIFVENWVDRAVKPKLFTFITKNQIAPEIQRLFRVSKGVHYGCECTDGCGSPKACCQRSNKKVLPYAPDGRLPNGFNTRKDWIAECSDKCSCDIKCPTRVVQRGRQIPIVLFRTADRGWSVRTAVKIEKNTFVMEYVGEVLTSEQADKRALTYQFQVKATGKSAFVVDATRFGNEARFVNHSCSPNMIVEPVDADSCDDRYYRFAFFASRNIKKGEEITFNYFVTITDATYKKITKKRNVKCLCKAKNCRGYFFQ